MPSSKLKSFYETASSRTKSQFQRSPSLTEVKSNIGVLDYKERYTTNTKKYRLFSHVIPEDKRQSRRFLGMTNFYKDIVDKKVRDFDSFNTNAARWQWTKRQEKAFQMIKKVFSTEVLLTDPN